jgi:ADP-ribosylglycohydrolase
MKPETPSTSNRASGAILGAFIGDALGLGPHWYYDLDELRKDFGPWIDGYTTPKSAHRYHAGMQAGDLSQAGLIMLELLRSLAECDGYEAGNFTRRLDDKILANFDGNPFHGPGGYTNHSIRQTWQARTQDGKEWGEAGGNADTSEAAERVSLLAACFAADPCVASRHAYENAKLTQTDPLVLQHSVAFASVLAAIIRGEAFDSELSDKLMKLVESGEIPFTSATSIASSKRTPGEDPFGFASPDALMLSSWITEAAHDPGTRFEPAWKVSLVYGMSCAISSVLPGAYYLAARFPDDFESAVLHAINGGGQNMSRACLTGALVGAQVGLCGIPSRFIDGLADGAEIVALAKRVTTGNRIPKTEPL